MAPSCVDAASLHRSRRGTLKRGGRGSPVQEPIHASGTESVILIKKIRLMRSQIRFVMHPDDEAEFAQHVNAEPGTVFVDGPNWPSSQPPVMTEIERGGDYLMIWNSNEAPSLKGKRYRSEGDEWWSCETEYLTIQFLRSGFQFGESFLFEGRIAVATTDQDKLHYHRATAPLVERRFKLLRKWIRQSYSNGVIIWQNIRAPRSRTNPLKPAADVWVGPHALQWFRKSPRERWTQQERDGASRGYILDLVRDKDG